jgi:hypothetical protein
VSDWTLHSGVPLGEVREWLRERVHKGAECPVCRQYAKVYAFPINAAMARALILMYRQSGTDWVHVPSLGLPGGHFAKMRYWGLIEGRDEEREDGSRRNGWWRVTPSGEQWINDKRCSIPERADIYDNRCLGLHGSAVTIREVLGRRFDYDDLMEADAA